jgi:hypothetical protein
MKGEEIESYERGKLTAGAGDDATAEFARVNRAAASAFDCSSRF